MDRTDTSVNIGISQMCCYWLISGKKLHNGKVFGDTQTFIPITKFVHQRALTSLFLDVKCPTHVSLKDKQN